MATRTGDSEDVKYAGKIKMIFQLCVLFSALVLAGMLMNYKITQLLNATLENELARRTADMSIIAEERFLRELSALKFASEIISENSGEAGRLLELLKGGREGVKAGILALDGSPVLGDSLTHLVFSRVPMAFRGSPTVDHSAGTGLVFAVPVMRGPNVSAVLFRLYDESLLTELFGLEEYNSESRLMIQERSGEIIVPYRNYGSRDKAFFADASILDGFSEVRARLYRSRSAALYYDGPQGKYFLFAADLPQTNCSMVGYVPWGAVAGGISRIYTLLVQTGSVILVLFAGISAYLFFVQAKADESEFLREAKEIADRANSAKSAFLANMSHEIRTPINAVLGMNEMIIREEKDPGISRYALNVRDAGETLLSIINDILDFSKIESGKMEISPAAYRLSALIGNVANMIRPRAEKKGLLFRVDVDGAIPDGLFGDMVRVQQVAMNLLTNAVKYTERGRVDFIVSHTREGETVLLKFTVRDTGIGIREADREKLFQDFSRFDMEKNRNIEGTGLGLAITKSLAKAMGGEITIESVYGEGSEFSVTLPQKITDETPTGSFAERPRQNAGDYDASFTAPDARILVTDDSEMNLVVVEGLLKKTLVAIDTCKSGEETLAKLAGTTYDAVLLDHMMPGMDGVETLHRAKKIPGAARTPFIVLTANAISGAREAFLREGFDDYLSKPLDGAELERMLADYLPQEKVTRTQKTPGAQPAQPDTASSGGEPVLDVSLGLKYSGGMEDMYRELAEMFCRLRPEKQRQMSGAFDSGDWKTYTTLVHALKSNALSVGGKPLSDAAKSLEMSGKICFAPDATEEEKKAALAHIREAHAKAMDMYDALAAELETYLAHGDRRT